MSTTMYNFRLKKDDLWPFADYLRKFYLEEGILGRLFATYSFEEMMQHSMNDEHRIFLQLFEEPDRPDTWNVRLLARGWLFWNKWDDHPFELEQVVYDNRSDITPEEEGNNMVADLINRLISANHYFIVAIFDKAELRNIWWASKESEKSSDEPTT